MKFIRPHTFGKNSEQTLTGSCGGSGAFKHAGKVVDKITLNESIQEIKWIEFIWISYQKNPDLIRVEWIHFRSLDGKSLDKEFCCKEHQPWNHFMERLLHYQLRHMHQLASLE